MHDFKKLKIWQRSKDLSVSIYQITSDFPKHEVYGLTSQIRRAATSVAANIAEGSGRGTSKDFSNFLAIALGSLNELYTFTDIALALEYITKSDFESISKETEELRNMIFIFRKNL